MRPHALPTGTELGGYVLHGVLGTGASGTVYRATDAEGLPVALKLLHPEVAAGTDARIRLRREVTAQRSIRSPFVAKVVDAELDQAEAFVVTEQISGRTLEAAVAQGGAWSTDQLAELGDYLLQAVDAVHAAGVLHRDIKPANVMLREDGTPVLIDFGIAQDDTSARLTGTGQVVGTPGFVAAELLRGQNPTPATDRFAAAATLLRAATGRAPFGGGPIDAVLARVLEGSPDTAGLPEPIQQAFRAALSPVEASRLPLDALIRALQSGVFHEDLPPTAAFGGPAMPLQPLPPAAGEAGAALPDRFGHTAEGHRVAPGPAPPADATQPFDPEGHRELLPPVWDESPGLFPPGAAGAPEGLGPPDRLGPLGQPGLAALPAAGPDLGVPGLDDAAAQDLPGPAWRPLPSPDEVSPPKRRVLVACLWAAAAVAGAAWPIPTAIVVGVALVLARTVWEAHQAQLERLRRRGPKRTDRARTALGLPWYLLRGAVGNLWAIGLGLAVGLGGYWLIRALAKPGAGALTVLAGVAIGIGTMLAWWGPSAWETRAGARRLLGWALPTPFARWLVGLAALTAAGLGIFLLAN